MTRALLTLAILVSPAWALAEIKEGDVNWKEIGHANSVLAMAAHLATPASR